MKFNETIVNISGVEINNPSSCKCIPTFYNSFMIWFGLGDDVFWIKSSGFIKGKDHIKNLHSYI